MPIADVKLGLKPTIVLPQTIKISVALMQQLHLPRWVAITQADQVVPHPLRAWMINHRDYQKWFLSGEVLVVDAVSVDAEVEVSTTENPIETPRVADVAVEDTPEPGDDVPPWLEDFSDADDPPPIEDMTIPELKAFAKENAINLSGKTVRKDIQDAIYDALADD